MPRYKVFAAEVRLFGEPAIIITAAYANPGGYPRAEYYLLISDEVNTLFANELRFEVKSFENSPVELNEEFMLSEALGQARIDLLLYLQQQADQGKSVVQTNPMILDSNSNVFVQATIRGTFPQLESVYRKTKCDLLLEVLEPRLRLPKLLKQKL